MLRSKKPLPKLWLAIRLPLFPLNALGFTGSESEPLAIIEKNIVTCVNDEAWVQGARIGMDVTTARLMSGCDIKTRDALQEEDLLTELSAQMYEFTSYIETFTPKCIAQAGLLLEVASSLRLFKGVESLVNLIQQQLEQMQFPFELGIAHTAKGAWLLTHHEQLVMSVDAVEEFIEQLKTLPIQLLYEFPKDVEALEKTGFVTLGDIAQQIHAQSISGIKKRFSANFTEEISNIFGIEHDFHQPTLFEKPAVVFQPEEHFSDVFELEYPTSNAAFLRWPVEVLLKKLADYLCKRQLETQRIEWVLSDIHRNNDTFSVYCDVAQSHWELFFKLTLIQIDARELPFEVDTMTLSCPNTLRLQRKNQTLVFDENQGKYNQTDLTITLAKLGALLGETSITKLSYRDSLLPEECNAEISLNQTSNQTIPKIYRALAKPFWLLNDPAPVEVKAHGLFWQGHLTLHPSPRRVRSRWRDNPVSRDYYIAQHQNESHLLVFRDNQTKQWFVQGIFAAS